MSQALWQKAVDADGDVHPVMVPASCSVHRIAAAGISQEQAQQAWHFMQQALEAAIDSAKSAAGLAEPFKACMFADSNDEAGIEQCRL